jgi:large subunit ribosomal protein L30
MAKLRITWVKSAIGYAEAQKRTLKSLGLRRLNQSVIHEDSAPIRGMVEKVKHLVKMETDSGDTE